MKRCENCGQGYYRRNLSEAWVKQAPGHRDGWVKRILRICTHCQGETQTTQIVRMFRLTHVPTTEVRRRRSA